MEKNWGDTPSATLIQRYDWHIFVLKLPEELMNTF